jgi:zinc and cadmium transporter
MLGAAFFHVMPDAFELCGAEWFGWWMSLGAVGLFCIERFIAPHSHEVDGGKNNSHHDHAHEEPAAGCARGHDVHETHEHGSNHGQDARAAAPAVAGWTAVLGLTIHTFMNGVGLAGEVQVESSRFLFPGMAIFVAIVLHKPADALAISTVLSRKGTSRKLISLVQLGFATMVPIGVVAFFLTSGALTEEMQNHVTGAALAFSAGTFLFVALSDLLPEVQFHHHDRLQLFLALVLGVAGMGGIALLEGHDHDSHGHNARVSRHAPEHEHAQDGN